MLYFGILRKQVNVGFLLVIVDPCGYKIKKYLVCALSIELVASLF